MVGFEPTINRLKVCCHATWLHTHKLERVLKNYSDLFVFLVSLDEFDCLIERPVLSAGGANDHILAIELGLCHVFILLTVRTCGHVRSFQQGIPLFFGRWHSFLPSFSVQLLLDNDVLIHLTYQVFLVQ